MFRRGVGSWILAFACAGGTPPPDLEEPNDTAPEVEDTDLADSDVSEPSDTDSGDTGNPGLQIPDVNGFVELGREAGLLHRHWEPADDGHPCQGPRTHTGGFAVGDYDNDGDQDIFFPVLDRPSRLYRNRGDGTFIEVGRTAGVGFTGWPSSAAWADVDNDGDLDLSIGFLHGDWFRLYENQGDGKFIDVTTRSGIGPSDPDQRICPLQWGLAWTDADLDGDLDLFIGSWGMPFGSGTEVTTNTYWENDGTGRFMERTEAVGFFGQAGVWTYSPTWGDVNGDGRPDMALASDFLSNRLYLSGPTGGWVEATAESRVGDVENGMGSVLADLDDDGDLDWFVTSIFDARNEFPNYWGSTGNRLYTNDGRGLFTDTSAAAGLRDSGWGWGVAAFDLENDGDLDLAATNGHKMPGEGGEYLSWPFHEDPTRLWVQGATGWRERAVDLGLSHTAEGRGLVDFDLEGDGDRDLLLSEFGGSLRLWVNDVDDPGSWLVVQARRDGPNRFGVGATVWVQRTADDPPRRRELHANPTYLSQGPVEAHFGLGSHEGPIHRVTVRWPEGGESVYLDVAPRSVLLAK
jgi:hypothetical protein